MKPNDGGDNAARLFENVSLAPENITKKFMEKDMPIVFHGFLNLPNLEKLKVVEMINEYFDSNDREPIRKLNEAKFKEIDFASPSENCKCCGR